MTRTQLHKMLDGIAPIIREFVSRKIAAALEPVIAENKALAERVKELEARPQMTYRGTFAVGEKYLPGQMVTSSGSLWYCRDATLMRPGFVEAWVLVAKKGRDGRDVAKGAA